MSKNKRIQAAWLAVKESSLQAACGQRLEALRVTLTVQEQALIEQQTLLTRRQRDVEDLQRRLDDRKADLVAANEAIRPESVWLQAFSSGYARAWDTMLPIMVQGVQQSKEALRQEAFRAALATVESAVTQRVEETVEDLSRLRTFEDLAEKRKELILKREASTGSDQARYDHYLEVVTWMLNGHTT